MDRRPIPTPTATWRVFSMRLARSATGAPWLTEVVGDGSRPLSQGLRIPIPCQPWLEHAATDLDAEETGGIELANSARIDVLR
jgi:hypothetical protein